jgi:hypothetical protein
VSTSAQVLANPGSDDPFATSKAERQTVFMYGEGVARRGAVLLDVYENVINKQRDAFLKEAGGLESASEVGVWDGVRRTIAQRSSGRSRELLEAQKAAWANKAPGQGSDIVDEVLIAVASDMLGTTDPATAKPGYGAREFSTGAQLKTLLGSEVTRDLSQLTRISEVINLLGHVGACKLSTFHEPGQLVEAVNVMEAYVYEGPLFDPQWAGYRDVVANLTISRAAMEADSLSRPDEINPTRDQLMSVTYDGLASTAMMRAQVEVGRLLG